jgi:hypothetical protein
MPPQFAACGVTAGLKNRSNHPACVVIAALLFAGRQLVNVGKPLSLSTLPSNAMRTLSFRHCGH